MDMQTVKQIIANPYHDPADIVKFYLSRPQYLEEWLAAKGKALAGVNIDCSACVMSNYIAEKLTSEGFEVERVEVTGTHVEVTMEECDLDIWHPEWVQRFIKAIDMHRNPDYPYSKNSKSKIFSGNLARNILKATLAAGVE